MTSAVRPAGRRAAALTILIDLVAPTALYYGLHSAGASIYVALIAGSIPLALSATAKIIRHRRVDGLALMVMTMLLLSTGVSLISGSPRFLLAKDGWLTGIWAVLFFASVLARRPLTFLVARPLLEGRKVWDPRARRRRAPGAGSWDDIWERTPRFRRFWRVSAVIWGAGLLADAVIRVLMAYTLPVDVVPALGGALWPVTFIVLQVITNVYFVRSGMLVVLRGEVDGSQPADEQIELIPVSG